MVKSERTEPKQLTVMTGRMRTPPLLVPSCSTRAVWKTTLLYKPHGRESPYRHINPLKLEPAISSTIIITAGHHHSSNGQNDQTQL
ncbi:MAG: hypothetical protein GY820_42160 [Gammaproteobacteria bacterium]|nr:hypothetical protein [Gammaproteobacteria bacterium]